MLWFSLQVFSVLSAILKHGEVPALGYRYLFSGISLTAVLKQNGGRVECWRKASFICYRSRTVHRAVKDISAEGNRKCKVSISRKLVTLLSVFLAKMTFTNWKFRKPCSYVRSALYKRTPRNPRSMFGILLVTSSYQPRWNVFKRCGR